MEELAVRARPHRRGPERDRRRNAERLRAHDRDGGPRARAPGGRRGPDAPDRRSRSDCSRACRTTAATSTSMRSRRSRRPAGTSSASPSACPCTRSSAAVSASRCSATRTAGTGRSARPRRSAPRRSRWSSKGFKALKVDPFGTAQGFIGDAGARRRRRHRLRAATAVPRGRRPDRRPRSLHRGRGDPRRARLRAPRRLLVGGAVDARAGRAGLGRRARDEPAGRDRRDVPHGRPVLHARQGGRRLDLAARADVARRLRRDAGASPTSPARPARGSRPIRAAARSRRRSACSSPRASRTS